MPRRTLPTILIYSVTAAITLANAVAGRPFSQAYGTEAVLYLGSLLAPLPFAIAAGFMTRRPIFANLLAAFACSICLLWFYLTETRIWVMGNSWIFFNLSDQELAWLPVWPIILRILAVAMQVLSFTLAMFRLLPERWHIRNSQLRGWTWPAFVVSFAVLTFWFLLSTTPYRMPGAVDYSDYPTFQILHVEKHGLQIHEKCISLYERPGRNLIFVSADDRRLFQYRFQTKRASEPLSETLYESARPWTQFEGTSNRESNPIRPLRSWNAEGWYVNGDKFGFAAYTTENGRTFPPEIFALFRDFERDSPALQPGGQLKDVCLGFCFDQLAAMGRLYSNHRCFFDGKSVKCR